MRRKMSRASLRKYFAVHSSHFLSLFVVCGLAFFQLFFNACGKQQAVDVGGEVVLSGPNVIIDQLTSTLSASSAVTFVVELSNAGTLDSTGIGFEVSFPSNLYVTGATCSAAGAAVCGTYAIGATTSYSGLSLPAGGTAAGKLTLVATSVPLQLGIASVSGSVILPSGSTDVDISASSNQITRSVDVNLAQLTPMGGRLAWYTGTATNSLAWARPIAFDRIPLLAPTTNEVYASADNGTQQVCITCAMTFPKGQGFIGNPSWHPNGNYFVIQVENSNSQHQLYNGLLWGIDSDLWIVKADGTWAARVWNSSIHHGVLHPHLSPDGKLLVFAERWATAAIAPTSTWPGTDGQDPWRGWALRVARIDSSLLGNPTYNNLDIPLIVQSIRVAPNEAGLAPIGAAIGNGVYETNSISSAGEISYSFTPTPSAGRPNNQYVDSEFDCQLSSVTDLTGVTCGGVRTLAGGDPETWDEFAKHSPDGSRMSFMSSRWNTTWKAQALFSTASTLRTELYVMPVGNESVAQKVSFMNSTRDQTNRYLLTDHEWSPESTRLAFLVVPVDLGTGLFKMPEIWIVKLP